MTVAIAAKYNWTPQQIGELTMAQLSDLAQEPKDLEKRIRYRRMNAERRELARAVGYFDGDNS
jgi:hypothetical protein